MQNVPGLNPKTRDSAVEPNGMDLFKGLVRIAAGIVGISFIATSAPILFKIIFIALGIIFFRIGGKWIERYVSAYRAFRQFVPIWDAERGMYDRFAGELNAWQQDGIVPTCCDGDTLYYLKLQKERLIKKGLTMTNRVMPAKGSDFGTAAISRKSPWYTTDMVYENIIRTIRFDDRNGSVYEREVEQVMYEIIVHTPNDAQLTHITMTCPNCGAVSPVATLEAGCRYCGTRFRITDLFPRVVNLFFLKANTTATITGKAEKTIFFTMLAVFLVGFSNVLISENGFLPAQLALCFFAAGFCGGFLGLILASLQLLVTLFDRDGMKPVSLLKWSSSKKNITNILKKYDPNFAYDKFEAQIVALIRMAVFAEYPEKLACYRGGRRDERFSDILEMTYTNAVCLRKVRLEGNILHMSLRTWWINYSDVQGKVHKTGDCIDVEVSRNVAILEPPGFSITSVECPNCGGSFDAVRQKTCPYCGGAYHMENEGWLIDDMRLLR